LKFAYNSYDYLSYNRIINVPKRGLGDVTLAKITAFHEANPEKSIQETLHAIGNGGGDFNKTIRQKLKGLAMVCDDIRIMIEKKASIYSCKTT
jgi:DNA helicase-2/ATP-dependent DNA helicase PcrA